MTQPLNEWFGSVRTSWPVVPIRSVARLGTGHTPSRTVPEYWENCTIPWVTVEDIRRIGEWSLVALEDTDQKISELGLANSAAVLHPAGTVMLSRTASIGLSCIIGRDMATTQAFVTWTPDISRLSGAYLLAALKAMEQQYAFLAYGATHLTIYFPDIKTLRVPLPPLATQVAVADLLNRETSKIDALIAEQERLIALLQEKRRAVISHAVTKGLDQNVSMKDSGVEWIGDVPHHWSVDRAGRVFRSIGSGATPPSDNASYYDNSGVEWVNTGDLSDGPIDTVARRVSHEAIAKFPTLREYPSGAVVIAMYGATIGKLGVLSRRAVVNQACCVLSDGDGISESFLFYALLAAREAIVQLATGGTQPNISQATVRAFPIPVPPREEQSIIVARIKSALETLDALASDALSMIALLRERRTALITAAVAGQIDVRGLVETAI